MIDFLRRMGGLKDTIDDKKRTLIKSVIEHHGPEYREKAVEIVMSLSEPDTNKWLRQYNT